MQLNWQISGKDIARIKALIHQQADNPLVRYRVKNLAKRKTQIRKEEFWRQMVGMRLTSIQKSGPNSHVAKFNRTRPFPLSYKILCGVKHPETFIASTLKNAGGIRFGNKIAQHLAANFDWLEKGGWTSTLEQCNRLSRSVPSAVEKEAANYIEDNFEGFGPKQSRNLLQALRLTRHEIPIDSRITRWLNKFGFPVKLSATALADRHYYEFVSIGIQMLCAKSGVYPCILDAAIFAMSDGDAWTKDNVY
ncbi:MAG: hypothetical protein QOI05_1146 [Bradyrhizobium sp.]|jgi:hypothetical protein|nr:hypothetical protein [Bradyrhizobium sp.]